MAQSTQTTNHMRPASAVRSMAHIAVAAALLAVCSWLTIPFTVPFTMQTFAVFLTLLLLGGRDGTIAIGVYILLGAVGVPVFSGFTGGISRIIGATGGYIAGFLATGGVYWLAERPGKRWRIPSLVAGLAVCYTLGTLWFCYVTGTGFAAALMLCVVPFLLPDAVKLILAALLGARLRPILDR